jgi:hypothetical protein
MVFGSKKASVVHQDEKNHEQTSSGLENSPVVTGFEADESDLPKGYFRSRFFLGSYLAIGLGLWGGTAAL